MTQVERSVAIREANLEACIARRVPLVYGESAPAEHDRPSVVRAASGIVFLGDELCVIQDDASFLAVGRPGEPLRGVPLPAGAKGRRRFEERLGNKLDKLDLESCFTIATGADTRLVALGSGSLPAREQIAVYDTAGEPAVRLVDGSALYAALRSERAFSGGALNVEGAVLAGGFVRLFQRGNGAQVEGLPVPSTVDLDAGEFVAFLDGARREPPRLGTVRQYDLGQRRGARYGFTDAAVAPSGRIVFLASAEHSPDTVEDGEIEGTRIGVLLDGQARFTDLLDESGAAAALKAEGIAFEPGLTGRAWIVLDPDDPDAPAELCEVRLTGTW